MGSRCEVCLEGLTAAEGLRVAEAAEVEVVRIERRYSRFLTDSEVARINVAAASGGSIDVDTEMAALLAYAAIAYERSGGLFDPTSGLLRQAWNFSEARVPAQAEIDVLLPHIGFDKVRVEGERLAYHAFQGLHGHDLGQRTHSLNPRCRATMPPVRLW